MGKEDALTGERLRSLLSYDPESGHFTWLLAKGRRVKAGVRAGNLDAQGYVRIRIDGRGYRAHRLAWLHMTGSWPGAILDHRDRNRENNRWKNLRVASVSQNNANSSKRRNKTGYTGVKAAKGISKYEGYIREAGRMRSLGVFPSAKEAHVAYLRAAKEAFGEFFLAA